MVPGLPTLVLSRLHLKGTRELTSFGPGSPPGPPAPPSPVKARHNCADLSKWSRDRQLIRVCNVRRHHQAHVKGSSTGCCHEHQSSACTGTASTAGRPHIAVDEEGARAQLEQTLRDGVHIQQPIASSLSSEPPGAPFNKVQIVVTQPLATVFRCCVVSNDRQLQQTSSVSAAANKQCFMSTDLHRYFKLT